MWSECQSGDCSRPWGQYDDDDKENKSSHEHENAFLDQDFTVRNLPKSLLQGVQKGLISLEGAE